VTGLLRPCDGCDGVDDHPRFQYDDNGVLRLFHYDCTPKYIRKAHPSPGFAAADSGKRGSEVADVVLKHAAKLAKES
jgi:hypothetical protein